MPKGRCGGGHTPSPHESPQKHPHNRGLSLALLLSFPSHPTKILFHSPPSHVRGLFDPDPRPRPCLPPCAPTTDTGTGTTGPAPPPFLSPQGLPIHRKQAPQPPPGLPWPTPNESPAERSSLQGKPHLEEGKECSVCLCVFSSRGRVFSLSWQNGPGEPLLVLSCPPLSLPHILRRPRCAWAARREPSPPASTLSSLSRNKLQEEVAGGLI